jgi:hypothetical protein
MNDFDAKWQTAAAQARQATRREEGTPVGFAVRVLARAAQPERVPIELAWDRLMPRLLAGAVAVLLICAALEAPHWRDNRLLEPGIENTVAQLVWSL